MTEVEVFHICPPGADLTAGDGGEGSSSFCIRKDTTTGRSHYTERAPTSILPDFNNAIKKNHSYQDDLLQAAFLKSHFLKKHGVIMVVGWSVCR